MTPSVLRNAGAVVAALLMITSVVAIGGVTSAESGPSEGPGVVSDAGLTASSATGNDSRAASKPDPKLSSAVLELAEEAKSGQDGEHITQSKGQTVITVRVEAVPGSADSAKDAVSNNAGQVRASHGELLLVELPPTALSALADAGSVGFVTVPHEPNPTVVTSEGLDDMGVTQLHDDGVTGQGVTVAIIDVGFNVSNPEIESNVGDFEDFEGDGMDNSTGLHGTAVAELVVDTAPNATILLYEVGTEVEMLNAIDHVDENTSADLASVSLGWSYGPFDGTSLMDREIQDSIDNGTQWFVSAGNEANGKHLNRTWNDPDGNGRLNFTGDAESVPVTTGSGPLDVYVNWDDYPATDEDYDAFLLNQSGSVVAGSATVQNGSQPPLEYFRHSSPGGQTYYLVIQNTAANGTADFDIFVNGGTLQLSTATRSLTRPATGVNVVTVGAVDAWHGALEPFSSRGPTIDGRQKPDLVAPDNVSTSQPSSSGLNPFFGTSAAAPHAAGVGALILGVDGAATPAALEESLESTANPLLGDEPNNQTGHGLVDAPAAVNDVIRVSVSGQLDEADGTPAANDTLQWAGRDVDDGVGTITTSGGNFSADLLENATYNVRYWQDDRSTSGDAAYPKDGTVDVLAVDRASYQRDTNLGTGTLPAGHNLTVTVVNESGGAVGNVTVTVIDHTDVPDSQDPIHAHARAETNSAGDLVHPDSDGPGFEVNGTVHVQVGRSAGLSGNGTTVDVDSDRHLTLTVHPTVNVTGQVTEAAGDPVANDTLDWRGWDVNDGARNVTSGQGAFSTRLVENATYEVVYRQDNVRSSGDVAFPKDGSVDVFTFGVVSYSADATGVSRTLPEGHNLTVEVVNASGHPVENARVYVNHVVDVPNADRRASASVRATTNATGDLWHPDSDGPGFEVNGTVEVHVEPPNDQLSSNGTRVEVTGDEHVVITLQREVQVSGGLSEADGTPAANDTLRWVGRDVPDSAENVTSAAGAFSVSLVEGGTYDVRYWQDDRRSESDVAFPKDGTVDVLAAARSTYQDDTQLAETLPVGHNLTVTVVDESGKQVDNATVNIVDHTDIPNTDDDLHAHVRAETNATGDLVLPASDGPGLEVNGTVHVEVEPTARTAGNATTIDVDSDRHLTLTVHPTVNVSGQVSEAGGDPAASDQLQWHGWDVNDGTHNITTDQGDFSTRLVENGTYEVAYRQDDPRTTGDVAYPNDGSVDVFSFGVVSYSADATGVSRTLPVGHHLTVSVVDESGQPIENARVYVNHVVDVPNTERRASASVRATTNSTGDLVHPESDGPGFEVNGTVEVHVEPPRSGLSTNGTSVEVGSDTHLTFVLEDRVTASGRIVEPDGSAAANDYVVAKNPTTGVFNNVRTNGSGYYAVGMGKDELTSLTYVETEVFSDASRHDGVVDLYEFAEVNLSTDADLGEATLPNGHVLNVTVVNESGAPVENATIGVIHNGGTNVEGAGPQFRSNADGRFQTGDNSTPGIEVVGNVTVTVRPPENADGYAERTYTRELDVTSDTEVSVTLQEAVEVTGRLLEPDGTAAANDTVLASNDTQTLSVEDTARTDADGNYSIEVPRNEPTSLVYVQVGGGEDGLPPRDGVVDLYEFDEVTFSSAAALGETTLPNGHVLNVTVVNQSDVPVENASVGIRHEGGPNVTSIEPVVSTNADGMFQIENVTPGIEVVGNVTVAVEPPENATGFVDQRYTRELDVTTDTAVTVTLTEVDLTPPTIANPTAVDAADGDENVTDGDVVEVSADVADDKRPVDTVVADASAFGAGNVTLTDGNGDGTYNATFVVDGTGAPAEGPDVIDVYANDTEDNWNAAPTNELLLDLSAPGVTNASVGEGDVITENTTVTVNYTDTVSGVNASAVTLLVDGTERSATATATQLTVDVATLGLADGTHNFTVVLVDRVGLRTAASVNLTLDSTAPNVTELRHSRAGQRVSTNAPTTVTVDVSEPHPANATLRIEHDATGDVVFTADVNASFDGPMQGPWDATNASGVPVPTGNYTLVVVADDRLGHSTTETIDVRVDNTAPSIDSLTPADGALLNTSTPRVVADYSDADAGINASAVTLLIDGATVAVKPANVTADSLSTSLALGEADNSSHTLAIEVVDNASNRVQLAHTFTVDTEAPRLDLESDLADRISTNHPTNVTVSRTEAHPNATTLVIENATTDAAVYAQDLTGMLGSGTATVQWDATDDGGNTVASGQYRLVLESDDRAGNANSTSVNVTVDNTAPTVGFNALNVSDGVSAAPAGRTLYTNDTVGFNASADGTPGSAASVTFRLAATAVNFETDTAGTSQQGHWTAVADLSGVPDDGEYEAVAIAVDPAENSNHTTADATIVLDRQAPDLGATVSRVNDTTGRVNLTIADANPPAEAGALDVEVTLPNGTAVTVPMSGPSDSPPAWTGTFALGDASGDFDVVATGLDNASNRGRATASATIQQVSTRNQTVTVQVEATGTFVQFNTSQEVNNTYVSLTSSDSSPAPLSENLTGVSFLNGQLGDALDANLSDATIGVPVNESKLPEGVSKENATIGFFNSTTDDWELLNTTTRTVTINGTTDEYWVTNVTHFSTYGAVARDTAPPTLISLSPSSGTELAYGTSQATVRFEYADDVTGVNASRVQVAFNGSDVTTSSSTTVTSQYAEHTATGLGPGTYPASVTVIDEAGNAATFSTSLTIPADTAEPTVLSSSPTDGESFAAGTDRVTLSVSYEDAESGIDPSAIQVFFDGQDVTSGASVSASSVSYTATGLANDSSHTFRVRVVDNNGNVREHTLGFTVAAPAAADDGGQTGDVTTGGAGGGSAAPSLSVDVSTTAEGLSVSVENAGAGQTVTVDVPSGASVLATGVNLTGLDVTPTGSGDFTLTIAADRAGVPSVNASGDLGYVQVDHALDASTIGGATFRFTVSQAVLEDRGIAPGDVAMYRYHDGQWVELETTRVGSIGGDNTYKSWAPGLSVFAISTAGEREAALSLTGAGVGRTSVVAGETVSIEATVENAGGRDGTMTLELTVDGDVVQTADVTVPAGGTETVRFTHTFEAAGTYAVQVSGVEAGTVQVERAASPTVTEGPTTSAESGPGTPAAEVTEASPAGSPAGPAGEADGLPLTAIAIVALVVLVALAVTARRTGRL